MDDLVHRAGAIALGWAVQAPFCLLVLVVLGWGRAALSREEIRRACAQTALASVGLGFPCAWAVFTYCSRFNPSPSVPAVANGCLFALLSFPAYSALIALAPFEFMTQAAEKRGAVKRAPLVRLASGATLLLMAFAAVSLLGAACLFAAGPKALG